MGQPEMKPGHKRPSGCIFGHSENRIPGALCFSYYNKIDDWHAGIYLGIVGKEHVLFAQHGPGGAFGPESLIYYANPDYYIPETLLKNGQISSQVPHS
jgi:hypothetical protein